jgi:glycosyltransferase A (GT-A) superfamily protein (DUF2064 family)
VDLIVLAKEPVPGRVKTRLCPPCTPESAAALAAAALADTLDAATTSGADRVLLALDGRPGDWCPPGVTVVGQGTGTLSDRLTTAWTHTPGPALQIGMDTPQLTAADLDAAMAALAEPWPGTGPCTGGGTGGVPGPALDGGTRCVLGPAVDGDTRCVLGPALHGDTRCVLGPALHGDTGCVLGPALHGDTGCVLGPALDGDTRCVLGPALDGGWWALGLHRPEPAAFLGVPTSRPDTGARQAARLAALGLRVRHLPVRTDVDTWADARLVASLAPATRFAAGVRALARRAA